MGVEYFLLKPYKKEKFELGKGSWPMVFTQDDAPLNMTRVALHRAIMSEVAITFDDSVPVGYFRELAESIHEWCDTDIIQLVSDASEIFEYIQTGTRYRETA